MSDCQEVSVALGNGLVLNRWQAIGWTNDDPLMHRTSSSLNKLTRGIFICDKTNWTAATDVYDEAEMFQI